MTPEIFLVMWGHTGYYFLEAINYALRQGKLHLSGRQGIISIIQKKDRNPTWLKNWRPLTLLNTDYKILAKAITLRITINLDKLIYHSQTGFIHGCNISHNIKKLLDIMQFTEKQSEAIIISVDFEKAFDRVEKGALHGALGLLNYGPCFVSLIDLLYNDFESCIINTGHTSKWFYPTRGLHQRCPASLVIFEEIVEILGQLIRENEDIQGIVIDGLPFKSNQFADDMNLFSLFEEKSLNSAISTLAFFERNTGLKLNYDKTNVYRIGSLKNSQAKIHAKP